MSDPHIRQLLDLIKQQNTGIEKLLAERDRMRQEIDTLISWIQEDRDALLTLQSIYNNPTVDEASRIKAAGLCLPFERARPPSATIVGTFSLYNALERPVTIEHQAPLASDRGGEALTGPDEPAA
jgi:hypothetical protein